MIRKPDILQSCTATILLFFAAVDGLGKLLHPNPKAKMGERLRSFLDFMGGDYVVRKSQLSNLRNSLMHNAINIDCFMSQADVNGLQHLTTIPNTNLLYVNTKVLSDDLTNAYNRLRNHLNHDATKLKRAADRLAWKQIPDPLECKDSSGQLMGSPPPPIRFIHTK